MVEMAVTLLAHHACRTQERDATRAGSYRIRNSLADAGNNVATAGVRLASPAVLAFGLIKVRVACAVEPSGPVECCSGRLAAPRQSEADQLKVSASCSAKPELVDA